MTDTLFIEKMIQRGKEAGHRVKTEFPSLTSKQLNWRPATDSWSIAQCLDHLVVSDSSYFPALKKIAEGNYKMNAWERLSPFNTLFGKILVEQLQEKVKRKVKSPRIFIPTSSVIDAGIMDRFHKHLDSLVEYIDACKKTDLDKTHITSPISKFVTYSLRNAITILVNHEHRHIGQAVRVKQIKDFPS